MPLIEDPLTKLMEQVMGFTNLRQDVIASNIANANTPGYSAFDIVLRETMDGSKKLEPATSHPRHMSMNASSSTPTGASVERSREPARLDGNNVSLDKELMKMLENRVRYQVTMELNDRWNGLKRVARDVR
jgi:flagellar basal-body rod protein FlgB